MIMLPVCIRWPVMTLLLNAYQVIRLCRDALKNVRKSISLRAKNLKVVYSIAYQIRNESPVL